MSSPKFQPRRSAMSADQFGKAEFVIWRENPKSPTAAEYLATAKMQHAYAVVIRKRARTKYQSIKGYAEACGVSYDRMTKVLRGEALMRLDDIGQAQHLLGDVHLEAMKVMSRRLEPQG